MVCYSLRTSKIFKQKKWNLSMYNTRGNRQKLMHWSNTWTQGWTFLLGRWLDMAQVDQRSCGVSLTGHIQEPSGCNPVPCALGWTRCPPMVASNWTDLVTDSTSSFHTHSTIAIISAPYYLITNNQLFSFLILLHKALKFSTLIWHASILKQMNQR